ncbi:PREDICTED: uncharacterized protein LOC108361058 [Rhagoletis zephyria]|uniref:uncharacterized protein LOC108361058 n=1 Tax=Rhagoletis zephyria TaxID=28612 RepID=UPI0008115569|nr:PREDICTED: uncharacterized protein LOC108361058 [Rhagoletis zephyria]
MAGSNTVKGVLSELAKRVPKNQLSQFRNFLELHAKYNDRVNKYPANLPTIDWDYYRTNVRIEAIKMVDEFEKKYEELNKIFDDRVKLDTRKYFGELEKQRAVMQAEVNQYIAESNERIKAYEAEMERLSLMKPYSSMTMEEYISLRPEHADYIPHRRKPLFWPHDPDEQIPGPVGIKKPDDDDGSHPVKPSDFKGKTEEFVFNAGDAKAQKPMVIADSAEPQPIQTQPVEVKATKAPQECKPSTDNVGESAPEEVKRKLNPCNLIEKDSKKVEVEMLPLTSVQASPSASSKPTEKVALKSKGNKVEQQKKADACDMVKKEKQKEPLAADIDPCTVTSKGPYKDERKDPCVFLDPCQLKLGAGANTEAKSGAPKDNKLSQPCAKSKKPKIVECESKDGKQDVPSKVSEGKRGDTCARTPYYNPFRSEEENIKQEEEACDECKEEDPCESDKRSPKTPYYSPFKDKKE